MAPNGPGARNKLAVKELRSGSAQWALELTVHPPNWEQTVGCSLPWRAQGPPSRLVGRLSWMSCCLVLVIVAACELYPKTVGLTCLLSLQTFHGSRTAALFNTCAIKKRVSEVFSHAFYGDSSWKLTISHMSYLITWDLFLWPTESPDRTSIAPMGHWICRQICFHASFATSSREICTHQMI